MSAISCVCYAGKIPVQSPERNCVGPYKCWRQQKFERMAESGFPSGQELHNAKLQVSKPSPKHEPADIAQMLPSLAKERSRGPTRAVMY